MTWVFLRVGVRILAKPSMPVLKGLLVERALTNILVKGKQILHLFYVKQVLGAYPNLLFVLCGSVRFNPHVLPRSVTLHVACSSITAESYESSVYREFV